MRIAAVVVILGAVIMFALNIGGRTYRTRDVPRYAVMAFEMRHLDTLVPTQHGEPYYGAMPLAAWFPLAVARVTGSVTPATARVVPACCGVALVLLVMALVSVHGTRRQAVLAGGMLALNELVIVYARGSRVDVPFALFVAGGIAAFFHAARTGRLRWYVVAGIGAALSVAVKGPLGPVLGAAALVPWLVAEKRWKDLAVGSAIVLGVAGLLTPAWFLPYLRLLGPERADAFIHQFILNENVAKFEDGYGKAAPIWDYLVELPVHFAPWVLFSTAALVTVLRRWKESRPLERLCVSWVLGPLLVLSLATGKNARYLLPMVPALAALAGFGLDRWSASFLRRHRRAAKALAATAAVVLLGAAAAAPFLEVSRGGPAVHVWGTAVLAAWCAVAVLVALFFDSLQAAALGLYAACAALVGFGFAAACAVPAIQQRSEPWVLAGDIAAVVPADVALAGELGLRPPGGKTVKWTEIGLLMERWIEPIPPGAETGAWLLAGAPREDRRTVTVLADTPLGIPLYVLAPAGDDTAAPPATGESGDR